MRKKANREQKKTFRNGSCVDCGAKLVDWERIDKKNLKDSKYLISSLNHELIRKKFWEKYKDHRCSKCKKLV